MSNKSTKTISVRNADHKEIAWSLRWLGYPIGCPYPTKVTLSHMSRYIRMTQPLYAGAPSTWTQSGTPHLARTFDGEWTLISLPTLEPMGFVLNAKQDGTTNKPRKPGPTAWPNAQDKQM